MSGTGETLNITGSPTFRSLVIQSKNSAAHTVNFDAGVSEVTFDKLIAVGSSSSNKLSFVGGSQTDLVAESNGSVYGQNLSMTDVNFGYNGSETPAYIGSGSTTSGSYGWLLQDPPKISTLVDPLTTAPGSNPNWTVSGDGVSVISSGISGGGYTVHEDDEGIPTSLISTDTYDLVGSSLIFEVPEFYGNNAETQFGLYLYTGVQHETGSFKYLGRPAGGASMAYGLSVTQAEAATISGRRFFKISNSSGNTIVSAYSTNGTSWTTIRTDTVDDISLYRSVRIGVPSTPNGKTLYIGSTNPSFNASPTTTLNSPANNVSLTTTTPTLAFTATDPDGDDVSYQVQVGNADFSTLHMDVTTTTYASGTQQTRVVSPALTQGGIDYYWRVRAKDPSGSDTYGAWTTARKMTTEALPPSVTSGATTAITTTTATAAGEVTSANGATITERGIAYHTSTNPTTANSKQVVSGTTGSYSGNLTGLTPNTTYYWRAYATNSKGTTYGVNRNFTTEPRPPVVSTGTPSGTAIDSITVTGSSLTSNPDAQTIDEYGVVYSTSNNPTIANSSQTGTGTSSSFNNTLTGLAENTTYYIRAYAKWRGSDYVYGSQVSFKTQGRPVTTLNTPAASGSVTDVRPNLEFTGNDPDNNQITYQLQLNPTNSFTSPSLDVLSASNTGFSNRSDVKTDPFYSGNQIRYTLQSDLSRGTDYYWRVRGKDTNGSDSWGEWTTARKFTVSAIAPTVTITGLADILDTSLKVNGTITDNGGATVTERGAVLSTSPNPTTSDLKFTATGETFTAEATGLTGSTTYYVRTYAINSVGTSYSTESTVMTLQPLAPPTLTVGDPTRLIDVSTQVTAEVTLDGRRDVTERGIVFSTSTSPDTDDNKVTANTAGLGSYTLLLTGLLPETTYYYRAYAINDQGTGYSAEKSFTTLAPFVPDEGDGYWVFSVTGSDAIVARSQATPADSSVSLPLADLNLEDGKTYTLAVGDFVSELGDLGISLLYYDAANPVTTNVPENSQLTFTYNLTDYHTYILQLHVTGDDPVAEELTATFKDLYLAEESTFSDFVPFTPYGLFEIKLENNQIVDKRRQDVIQSMYNQLEGWEITPFEVTTEGLGYFEIGDGITIKDPQDNEVKSYLTEYTLTLDGGVTEKLIGKRPAESKTDYSKAGNIKKLISNTTLQVDKQNQTIEALVADVYDNDGYIEEKFTQVTQDINQVRTTIQGAGGVNLIRNSVMYAYNNLGYPENWTTTHVDGEGTTIVIQGSPESQVAGGLSAHSFILNGVKVAQTVPVRKDADFISDENKTYYTFNVKVKKNLVGVGYIKLSNRQEEHTIDLPNGDEYLWEDFKIEGLLPQDDHYEIELYSDTDAAVQFTDIMLSVGEYSHAWTQAPGEAMSMVKSDLVDGTYWRSPQSRYEYSRINHQGLNVHKRIRGQQEEVFRINSDESNMSKIRADKQIAMGGMRMVPLEIDGMVGWADVGEDN